VLPFPLSDWSLKGLMNMVDDPRFVFRERAANVNSLEEAILLIEDISVNLNDATVEYQEAFDYISALSGFLVDYEYNKNMDVQALRHLCTIVFESLYYE
jgi:hypothetical protein